MSFPLQCADCGVPDDESKVEVMAKEEPVAAHSVTRMTVIQSGMKIHGVVEILCCILMFTVNVPKDPGMLLRTSRQTRVQRIEGEKYIHFGSE